MRPVLKHIAAAIIWSWVTLLLIATPSIAQKSGALDSVYADAGLDQLLGEKIPLNLTFKDEVGADVLLQDLMPAEKPVILTFAYHSCPMLCNMLLDGMTDALVDMEWSPGEEFEIITLSIDPRDTPEIAGQKKALYIEKLARTSANDGWHFLTGDEASIQTLADAVGFRYGYVEEIEQYVHPPILTVLSPDGTVSRYLQGITYNSSDIRLALVEASNGEIGTPIDFVKLFCLQYDPETNEYVAHAANLMKLGGLLTVFVLGMGLFVLWRKEVKRSPAVN